MNSRIDDIKKRLEASTSGPWEVRYRELDNHEQAKVWAENYGWLITRGDLPRSYHDPSMEFIAHCPEDISYLLELVKKQQAAIKIFKKDTGDCYFKIHDKALAKIKELLGE